MIGWRLKLMWHVRLGRWRERMTMKIAWLLPRQLVYWSAIRLIAHGTTGPYGDTVVPELTAMDALGRWDDEKFGYRP